MTLTLLACTLYVVAGLLIWRRPAAETPARWIPPVAIILHGSALLTRVFHDGAIQLGLGEAMSLFTWLSSLLLWVLCWREPLRILGVVIYPITALAALTSALWVDPAPVVAIGDWKARVHILLSLFSAGLLSLAAVNAVVLAVQDRLLHRHQLTEFARALPPLQTMERALFQLIGIGFTLLSLTLASGLWFIHDWLAQHLAHKTILSLTAWLIFGILLHGRIRYGWRGRTAIRWALAGYTMLILSYFGSKLILEEFLGLHWS